MRKICLLLLTGLLLAFYSVNAQQEESFKPSGKVEVRIFSHFTSSFSDGDNFNKFDVTRAYLGYAYDFSKRFRGKITYDVGNPGAGKTNTQDSSNLPTFSTAPANLASWGDDSPLPVYVNRREMGVPLHPESFPQ